MVILISETLGFVKLIKSNFLFFISNNLFDCYILYDLTEKPSTRPAQVSSVHDMTNV